MAAPLLMVDLWLNYIGAPKFRQFLNLNFYAKIKSTTANYLPIILLFIGGVILTAGDTVMKKLVLNNTVNLFAAGLAIYLVGLVFLAISFKYKNIAVASVIFVLFNVATLSIVSWIYFKELLSAFQIIGILLGIGAIVCLEMA